MKLYLRLAWRNVWRHKRRTIIIVLAMAIVLSLMMFYDGLIVGFNQAIYGNAIKVLGGNIQVHAEGYKAKLGQKPLLPLADGQAVVNAASAVPQVVAAMQRINTGGLASSAEGAFSVEIIGIQPEVEQDANLAAQHIVAGRFLAPDDGDVVLIGKGLADAMGVAEGDRITLTGRSLHEQMRRRTMTVVGIYDLSMPEIEKNSVYVSLSEAQSLYDLPGQATEVSIVLEHVGEEAAVMKVLQPALPGYEFSPFQDTYPELESAIATKGAVMNVFSVVMIFIAGIGILNLLLMAIYERTREIGVLGAMGLRPGQISLLFILEGFLIGLVGVVAGIVLGLFINGMLMQVGMDFSAFSTVTEYTAMINDRIYPSWGVEKLFGRAVFVALFSALMALYPAYEASRREPAEALHYV